MKASVSREVRHAARVFPATTRYRQSAPHKRGRLPGDRPQSQPGRSSGRSPQLQAPGRGTRCPPPQCSRPTTIAPSVLGDRTVEPPRSSNTPRLPRARQAVNHSSRMRPDPAACSTPGRKVSLLRRILFLCALGGGSFWRGLRNPHASDPVFRGQSVPFRRNRVRVAPRRSATATVGAPRQGVLRWGAH